MDCADRQRRHPASLRTVLDELEHRRRRVRIGVHPLESEASEADVARAWEVSVRQRGRV